MTTTPLHKLTDILGMLLKIEKELGHAADKLECRMRLIDVMEAAHRMERSIDR